MPEASPSDVQATATQPVLSKSVLDACIELGRKNAAAAPTAEPESTVSAASQDHLQGVTVERPRPRHAPRRRRPRREPSLAEDPQHTLELQLLDLEGQILQMDLQVAAIESRLGISRADEEG